MLKYVLLSLINIAFSQPLDSRGCLNSLGYTWCHDLKSCIHNSITTCNDNDNDKKDDKCAPLYTPCDDYVCPKIEDITCNSQGIEGMSTYRLSLIINNDDISNIYAIYGDRHHEMIIPGAYNENNVYSNNIGGIQPLFYTYNENLRYDSWLTIGITDGNQNEEISSVGIDFTNWNIDNSIHANNGAVFLMNPNEIIVKGNEYVIAQLTIPSNNGLHAVINVQGKFKDLSMGNHWDQTNIVFVASSRDNIPNSCSLWYNGCAYCLVENGDIISCDNNNCGTITEAYCVSYIRGY